MRGPSRSLLCHWRIVGGGWSAQNIEDFAGRIAYSETKINCNSSSAYPVLSVMSGCDNYNAFDFL